MLDSLHALQPLAQAGKAYTFHDAACSYCFCEHLTCDWGEVTPKVREPEPH